MSSTASPTLNSLFQKSHRVHEYTEPDQVVPMKVLFKDEKYTAETIDILSQIAKDAKLDHFVPQVSFCRFYLMNIKNSVGTLIIIGKNIHTGCDW